MQSLLRFWLSSSPLMGWYFLVDRHSFTLYENLHTSELNYLLFPFLTILRNRTPTTWVRGPHDTIKPHGGSVADVRQAYDLLVSKNVSTQLCIYPSLPLKSVHNSYFTLVPGVGLEVSQELFKYLQNEGVYVQNLYRCHISFPDMSLTHPFQD